MGTSALESSGIRNRPVFSHLLSRASELGSIGLMICTLREAKGSRADAGQDTYGSAFRNMDVLFDPRRFFFLLITNRWYLFRCHFLISQKSAGCWWGPLSDDNHKSWVTHMWGWPIINEGFPLEWLTELWKVLMCNTEEMHRARYGAGRSTERSYLLQACHLSNTWMWSPTRKLSEFRCSRMSIELNSQLSSLLPGGWWAGLKVLTI